MSKNHMAEVAALLGVELGEPFKITDDTHDDCQRYHRFTESAGIEISDDGIEWKTAGTVILKFLLMGNVRIVKLPWKPKVGDKYYYVEESINGELYIETIKWNNDMTDYCAYRCGNCFASEEEANAQMYKLRSTLCEYYSKKENE